ncbi:TetR/AcrR family transcriptional regulator [Pseudodesulfovibrio sp. zrk46]|uniref:TetR/AcrR family transcriptional regulator n=1 Tax=Pseudodesulfovibrio sp. zrk46 TaxID=2725288 RepID=UPI00144928EF|nr:TetR/AcrR family transcriptional regulator [Pseudodesulfovibrio sp. zrk46]QJB56741.1 TetR/AcrR family transcriptional regulator [Pseudodesulfovibrio sp. zrk46]
MTKKELIFHAAAKLFAQKTFDAVGIREIANEAGVNSAMISYYFGGKINLLRDIFAEFCQRVKQQSDASMNNANTLNELTEQIVRNLLKDSHEHPDVYLVGLRQLNHDSEELQDLRDDLTNYCWAQFSENLERFGITNPGDLQTKDIRFTAIMGMVFSDHLLGGNLCRDNKELAERYTDIVVDILQRGIPAHWT